MKSENEDPVYLVVRSVRVESGSGGTYAVTCQYTSDRLQNGTEPAGVVDRPALAVWFESVINRALAAEAERFADDEARRRQTPGMYSLLQQMRRGELGRDTHSDDMLARIEKIIASRGRPASLVCGSCGLEIARRVGYTLNDGNTWTDGECSVCGATHVGVLTSGDWLGRGDND